MKKFKSEYILALGIALITLISCSSTYNFRIDVLKPAIVPIQSDIKKIIIINYSYVPGNLVLKDFDISYYDEIDSTIAWQYINSITEFLKKSPRFQLKNIYKASKPLNNQYKSFDFQLADSLCKNDDADAAIILESFSINIMNKSNKTNSLNKETAFLSGSDEIYPEEKPDSSKKVTKLINKSDYDFSKVISIKNTSCWEIYSPSSHRIIDKKIIKNYYNRINSRSWSYNTSDNNLINLILSSCDKAGNEYGHRIAQEWVPEQRYVYRSQNSSFNEALIYAKNNNWTQAIEIWKKFVSEKDLTTASFAAYNIAVGYEVKDDLDIAIEWASQSYLLQKNEETVKYISLLEKRIKDKKKLLEQVNFGKPSMEI